jgi:aminopeptidase N
MSTINTKGFVLSSTTREIKLSDYTEPYYFINDVFLDFDLSYSKTQVLSVIKFTKNGKHSEDLVLDGENLKLLKINLNETELSEDQYQVTPTNLILKDLPEEFNLSILVEIGPDKNLSGEGLYKSGNILCTQNEAEGFRKITYYLDRPDVMAPFTTSLTANKNEFPYILANGNKVSEKIDGEKHTVVWKDPHPKPCYLFALVAGNLSKIEDKFTTKSGRSVALEIYVDPGNEDKCDHAMESLKNSMKWDEETFGLEYDLDVYMIVAVDSFNMGAMENKGLNIFNSAYVLAKKETATDSDFQGIESVIGHEYFHNWTGNRVTCRDWFQLTLKEGLTVFRDQEFSADMLSRPVKRIEDVQTLRRHQFKEDAGPLSHPIQPKSYIEINNFYTATVYEKGAEVIRMIHTIVGKEKFRKGMDLYFKRHDGQAVTTQDFVSAMADASNVNLDQFKLWYDQNGTPDLLVNSKFDNGKFQILFEQKSLVEANEVALHIPMSIALVDTNGKILKEETIQLKDLKTSVEYTCDEKPVLSLNRGFTAPVSIHYENNYDELSHILKYESDAFARYDSVQQLYLKEIRSLINAYQNDSDYQVNEKLLTSLKSVLNDENIDPAFKSFLFSIQTQSEINELYETYPIEESYKAINTLKVTIANNLYDDFKKYYDLINQTEFKLDAQSMGERQFKNMCLSFIAKNEKSKKIVQDHFLNANNMTDEFNALRMMHFEFKEDSQQYLNKFFEKWKHETLVMQKWLGIQASNPKITIKDLEKLESNEVYDNKVPNLIRAIVGQFANNVVALNKSDGSGYAYVATKILEIDQYNPQMAARLAKFLNHSNRLDKTRRIKLKESLELLASKKLSNDTYEVVHKNLKGN